jgi:ribosomal protein L9
MELGIEKLYNTEDKIDDFIFNNITNSIDDLNIDNEGMLLQDILSGIPFSSTYLTSIDRLKARLYTNLETYRELDSNLEKEILKLKPKYLLEYKDTIELIEGVNIFNDVILQLSDKNTSITNKDIINALHQLGIDVDENPHTKTNWKVGGSGVSRRIGYLMMGSGLASGNPFVFVAGLSSFGIGKIPIDIRQSSISARGWNINKLVIATEKTLGLLSDTKKVVNNLKKLNKNISDKDIELKENEFKTAGIILKKSITYYKRIIAVLGRGLGSVNKDIIEFKKGLKESIKKPKDDDDMSDDTSQYSY